MLQTLGTADLQAIQLEDYEWDAIDKPFEMGFGELIGRINPVTGIAHLIRKLRGRNVEPIPPRREIYEVLKKLSKGKFKPVHPLPEPGSFAALTGSELTGALRRVQLSGQKPLGSGGIPRFQVPGQKPLGSGGIPRVESALPKFKCSSCRREFSNNPLPRHNDKPSYGKRCPGSGRKGAPVPN